MTDWALKTTWGAHGVSEWPMFVREGVVAIGWHEITVDPSRVTAQALAQAVGDVYGHQHGRNGAQCLKHFVSFAEHDLILVCRGYLRAHGNPIHIYGYARIKGPFVCEPPERNAWRFKHKAFIQRIEKDVPRDVVVEVLRRRGLGRTVHDISHVGIEPLAQAIGVPIKI